MKSLEELNREIKGLSDKKIAIETELSLVDKEVEEATGELLKLTGASTVEGAELVIEKELKKLEDMGEDIEKIRNKLEEGEKDDGSF